VDVARRVEAKLAELEASHLPAGVHVRITRNLGETANDKVNELVENLLVALVIVIALFAWTLGWREGLVVAVAVPITFSLTLLFNYFAGYTINRVTLFALILSLGLVVDDPVVDVENIHRHFQMRRGRLPRSAAVNGRPPILYATLAVIVSFLPMFFITGMMGPYMRPMAINVPLAMAMSMVVAFTITRGCPTTCSAAVQPARGRCRPRQPEGRRPADLKHVLYLFYRWLLLSWPEHGRSLTGMGCVTAA
jgi:multidrug efflux pump subunit AcrB